MATTVFSDSEPQVAPPPSDSPMVIGNPALIRRLEGSRRRPAWMVAAPLGVLAVAAAGAAILLTHNTPGRATSPLATAVSPPPTLIPTPVTPVAPALAMNPVAPPVAPVAPATMAPAQRMAMARPARAASSHVRSTVGRATSASDAAADASSRAPVNPAPVFVAPAAIAPVNPTLPAMPVSPPTSTGDMSPAPAVVSPATPQAAPSAASATDAPQ